MCVGFIGVLMALRIATGPVTADAGSVVEVTVDGAIRHQTIEGFGTCLIAWAGRFRDLYRTEEFHKIYVEGIGCNMLRVNMWGPTFEKPTEDWAQIRCEDFDMSADGGRPQIFVDFGRGIRRLNPDVKIIGTAWSPPAWMKVNQSITDTQSGAIRAGGYGSNNNRVDPKYFKHLCKWMVEYVKLHDRQGVPFYAVSPGNEVQFSQSFESCVWDGKDFATIVVMLREMLDAEGYSHVKIFGPETMTSHLYEGGTGDHDWPAPIQKGIGNALHNALVAGNCSAFVPWQITEGRKSIHALMVMSEYTPKTYTAMHYTRFLRPGARRIDAEWGLCWYTDGGTCRPEPSSATPPANRPGDRPRGWVRARRGETRWQRACPLCSFPSSAS